MAETIEARFVIEIMGRPAEHLKESLKSLLERLKTEKGLVIKEIKQFDPRKIEKSQDLYTAFAEIEVEMESLDSYFGIIFGYMPSHVEIISPERMKIDNGMLNQLGNALVSRLHQYDAIAKQMMAERNILIGKMKSLNIEIPKEILSSEKKG